MYETKFAGLPHSLRKAFGFPKGSTLSDEALPRMISELEFDRNEAKPRDCKSNDGKPEAFRKEGGKAVSFGFRTRRPRVSDLTLTLITLHDATIIDCGIVVWHQQAQPRI